MGTLELQNLTYSYDKKKKVLRGIDARMEAGKIYAILGPSGCGKTTLLSLLGGLDSPTSGAISLDYDFFHSHLLELSCGNDYTAKVIPRDINVWTARLFLGDADGFSILYYQDVDSLVYWANEAAYRWGLRGIAIWSLGQEDMRLWEVMPKQI